MARARVLGGVELEYEVLGDPGGPTLVLVMGLGAQLIHWPDELCAGLVDRGLRVVRLDNRDVGLSSRLAHLGRPRLRPLMARAALGLPGRAPYGLSDMAGDVVGLLDHLEVERAHVAGASMGGMIAQVLGLEHAARVRSVTSLMSSPHSRTLPRVRALAALMAPAGPTRRDAVERSLNLFAALRGDRFPFDAERARRIAELAYDRAPPDPAGFARQLGAVLSAPSRVRALRRLAPPALVLHGTADPLIPVGAGRATARAIPHARLHLIEGMGHHLPAGAWPELVREIADHVERVEAGAAAPQRAA